MLEIKDETFGSTFPFAPRYQKVNGFEMHYVDEGRGEPLVLVHGDPTRGYLWRKFIPVLSRRGRCIVPDHMGRGKSGVPREPYPYRLRHHIANLESLLLRLDLREITLVLHDWGGPVGLGFAARHPERIKRLVLMNTRASAPWPGAPFPRLLEIIRSERGEKFVRLALLCRTRDIPVTESDPSCAEMKRIEDGLAQFSKIPTFLVWGMRDPVLPESVLRLWQRVFPQAATREIEDASHFLQEDAPERVIGCVEELLWSPRS